MNLLARLRCLWPERKLAAYAAGAATVRERVAVESHLTICARCRASVAGHEAVSTGLAAMRAIRIETPPGFRAGVWRKIRAEENAPRRAPLPARRPLWVPAGLTAMAALLGVALWMSVAPPRETNGNLSRNSVLGGSQLSPVVAEMRVVQTAVPGAQSLFAAAATAEARQPQSPGASHPAAAGTSGSELARPSGAVADMPGLAVMRPEAIGVRPGAPDRPQPNRVAQVFAAAAVPTTATDPNTQQPRRLSSFDGPGAQPTPTRVPARLSVKNSLARPDRGEFATIAVHLDRVLILRIEVFTARGERVSVLHDGPAGPGLHEIRFDGRDRSGKALAAGVYPAVVSTGAWTEKIRLGVARQ